MLLTGDVVVNSAVSFLHPEWPFGFDRTCHWQQRRAWPSSTAQRPTRR
jgi:hypothetical protein